MALLNYLSDGLYATIDDVNYFKESKRIEFKLRIYSDDTKSILFAEKQMLFEGFREPIYLEDIHVKKRPQLAAPNCRWAIALEEDCDSEDVEWKARAGLIACTAVATEDNRINWVFESVDGSVPYYVKSLKKFFVKKDNSPWVEILNPQATVTWEKFFSTQAISDPKTNLYQQIYEWLKTQPGFENTRDA